MYIHVHEKSSEQCQKKEGANPGQLFQAFGPHQQGATQSLPGRHCNHTYMYCTCTCTCTNVEVQMHPIPLGANNVPI